jgi:DNA-binding beta-propeller fold protein YncE
MKPEWLLCLVAVTLGTAAVEAEAPSRVSAPGPGDLSPCALATSDQGRVLYVACASTNEVLVLDTENRQVTGRFVVPGLPSGLAITRDGAQLFVTCAAPESLVCAVETGSGEILKILPGGHTALSPVLSLDEKTLFICNRFNNTVAIFDLRQQKQVAEIHVPREPVSAALTQDGRHLLVANHLPSGRSDVPYVAATVAVVDTGSRRVVKELRLPNGSINLRQLAVSPDGKYACVPHSVGRFQVPVTQLDRGWVNTSAFTIIDLRTMEVLNTVLLDEVLRGAANPWATAWSEDGQWLFVSHAGTQELSIIDFPALLGKVLSLPPKAPFEAAGSRRLTSRSRGDVVNDFSMLNGLRRRVQLNVSGPRALVVAGSQVFVAGYFSDALEVIDGGPVASPETIPLNPGHAPGVLRKGEMYFNDATICFQGWQSCASCHDDDARVDGLNWDLLNDGIGNPKDTKSLLLCYETPPVMSLGVRATAAVAVRSGIQNSLGTVLPEEIAAAIDEWLKSLRPAPSPYLVKGHFSESAARGERLFKGTRTGCTGCHEGELLTDLRPYDVGTQNPFDRQDKDFDTPTLRELWRTAPYLHDGSAATLQDVLTVKNRKDEHGKTSFLTRQEIDDLVQYLLSL